MTAEPTGVAAWAEVVLRRALGAAGSDGRVATIRSDQEVFEVPDQLPPEALAADPEGEPERTPNASNDDDGPDSPCEDADQNGLPEGSVTAAGEV